ncbi:MAG: ferredoxin [Alphaproteobacteria bacterium]
MAVDLLSQLAKGLQQHGLILRGAFHTQPGDTVTETVGTIALVGNAGPDLWTHFRAERRDEKNPLDRWTKRIVNRIAEELGASAAYPSDGPPYHPFQQWAMRSEPVYPSPIGLLMHPRYGLWHAYRAAVLFSEKVELPVFEEQSNPCDTCMDKPCLSTCPVGAFSAEGYDVPSCAAHLSKPEGADCMELGCRARRACPVGRDYHYPPGQADFHMQAFLNPRIRPAAV